MAITEAEKKAFWIPQFLALLGFRQPNQPMILNANNREVIQLTANPEFYRRAKYIGVQQHQIEEKGDFKEIVITYIFTKE